MTRVTLVRMVLALVAGAQSANAQPRAIDVKRSSVTVRVYKSGLFRALADDHVIDAPLAEGSIDDSATPDVRLVIDARGMHVSDPGLSPEDRIAVQTRMLGPEVLGANQFPEIRFHSVAVRRDGADRCDVKSHDRGDTSSPLL